MNVSRPYEGLFPTVDSAVLTVLSRTERAFSGREIAKQANRSHTAAQKVLDRLVDQGLVTQQRGGSSLLYVLNRKHLAAPAVLQLASLRSALIDQLRAAISLWSIPPIHASLFGSAARGDGDEFSDIDLLVVRPKNRDGADPEWMMQIDALNGAVPSWTGNPSGLIELGATDVSQLLSDRPAVVNDIIEDGVDLAGVAARHLFTGRHGS